MRHIGTAKLAAVLMLLLVAEAKSADDKYRITDAEQAARRSDAITLCSDAGKDEDRLLSCMKTNRAFLSPACRTSFEEGLHRRGLR